VLADPRQDYYFLYPYEFLQLWGYGVARDGVTYRAVTARSPGPGINFLERYYYRGVDPPATYLDHWARGTVGNFLYEMYQLYSAAGDARAEKLFALADRVGRRSHTVQHNLGTAYYLKKDYRGAAPYFERAVLLEPDDSFTRYLLAECYDDLGRGDDARRELETALHYHPDYRPASITLETGRFVAW